MIRPVLPFLCAVLAAEANPRVDFAIGVIAGLRGDEVLAERKFETARQADPTALPLVRRAVEARMAEGRRAEAVKLYRDLAAARPEDLEVQLAYADFLEGQSQGDTLALKLSGDTLDAALSRFPGHPEVIRRLFRRAQRTADRSRQVELLDMLSMSDADAALLCASLSRGMFDAEDAGARERVDQRLIACFEAHPGRPELARLVSEHFRETDRPAGAIGILKRHTEVSPASLELRTRLGILYFSAKQEPEGEAALLAVLDINPRQWLAHQSLAKFYRLKGIPATARIHAGEALKLRGGAASDFLKLADEWLEANDPGQARILLEKAAFDHPSNREVLEKLAIASRRDPQTRDQAAKLFREAEATGTADSKPGPAFLMESAEALIAEGQSKAAEERLRLAIRSYPADAVRETAAALRRLASLWETEGRNTDAARALRQRADALDR